MTVPKPPDLLSIEDYLAGEEASDVKHVLVHRATPEGGFAIERHRGIDGAVPLPEIDASLPLAGVYDRVGFAG